MTSSFIFLRTWLFFIFFPEWLEMGVTFSSIEDISIIPLDFLYHSWIDLMIKSAHPYS